MKSKTALIRGGIFCVAAALSGCATNSMTRSGFLGDYEKLSPTRYENVLMYRAAEFEQALCRCRGGRCADQDRLGSHRWAR